MLTMPTFRRLPSPVYFRHGALPPGSWETHAHPWGQFNFVARGVMDLVVDNRRLVSPPHYAIWIPVGMKHASSHTAPLEYRSVYLAPHHCTTLPDRPCALTVSDLLRALLEEAARIGITTPDNPVHRRLAAVVLDQIRQATAAETFLPTTDLPALRAALVDAEAQLADARPIRDIARTHHMSLRTLERLAVEHLGMSFGEWRQRLRYMKASEALLLGQPIERVAAAVGYGSSSSFIEMFKRHAGVTPDRFRHGARTQDAFVGQPPGDDDTRRTPHENRAKRKGA